MVGIIIYTTGEKLLHKQGKLPDDDDWAEDGYYYWHLRGVPRKLKVGDRIYFAVKGYIRGYFIVEDIDDSDECEIEFDSTSWKDIKPNDQLSCKSFQGFKYADKVGLK